VGPAVGLDTVAKTKSLCPCRNSNHGRSARSLETCFKIPALITGVRNFDHCHKPDSKVRVPSLYCQMPSLVQFN